MASVEEISVALPPEVAAMVRQAVDDGEYASSSEVIYDALRDWTLKRRSQYLRTAELKKLWQNAVADESPGIPMNEVLDSLEEKYQSMADLTHGDR